MAANSQRGLAAAALRKRFRAFLHPNPASPVECGSSLPSQASLPLASLHLQLLTTLLTRAPIEHQHSRI
eukprot:2533861-Pleurochrysis_carterae.AAC.1